MNTSQILLENDLDNLLNIVSEKYEVAFENVSVGNHKLQVLQVIDLDKYIDSLAEKSRESIELPFWAKIWPASILLSYYLSSKAMDQKRGSLMELGCGIGVAGLFAAVRGFDVTLSDNNHEAIAFTKINILKNNLQDKAKVLHVDFARDRLSQKFDYIIGSEITYLESVYRGLVKFILFHLNSSSSSEVILAADYRRQAKKFFQAAKKEFHIDQKNIGYKGMVDQSGAEEKFLCAIYRMKPKKL